MIPLMLVYGLLAGRWWRFALVSSAVIWPIVLVMDGVTRSPGILLAAAALGAANAAVGVLVHQGLLWVVRRSWGAINRSRGDYGLQNG